MEATYSKIWYNKENSYACKYSKSKLHLDDIFQKKIFTLRHRKVQSLRTVWLLQTVLCAVMLMTWSS